MSARVLCLNPGGGSTRVAAFDSDRELFSEEVLHDEASLRAAGSLEEQIALRLGAIRDAMATHGLALPGLAAVVGRGGPYRPLPGGTYRVNAALLDDIAAGRLMAEHPSKLGAPLAAALAAEAGVPAFVVDPVSVDELWPVARLSGLPELPRTSLFHALNIRAVARRHAASAGRALAELRLVVAHLGSGISVALILDGRVVDVNNSADEGPFSTRRAGSVPASGLLDLAGRPGFDARALQRRLMSEGGLLAHLGSADLAAAEARAASGESAAEVVLEAMAYQVAKAIGALAAAAEGRIDAILLTGGMARSVPWLTRVRRRVAWIAPIAEFPGEGEMRALAEGALAVLAGTERERRYPDGAEAG
jgi:butyrate kinase